MKKNILILLASPDSDSLSAALAGEIAAAAVEFSAAVDLVDLYSQSFNPVLQPEEARRRFSFDAAVQAQQEAVAAADLIVWVHPDWWGGMPALMKGWIDRVLQPGFAFSFEEDEEGRFRRYPLLKGKSALAVITSDASSTEPVPAADMWQKRVFAYCGFSPAEVLVLPETRQSSYLERTEFFRACRDALIRLLSTEESSD